MSQLSISNRVLHHSHSNVTLRIIRFDNHGPLVVKDCDFVDLVDFVVILYVVGYCRNCVGIVNCESLIEDRFGFRLMMKHCKKYFREHAPITSVGVNSKSRLIISTLLNDLLIS